MTLEKEKKSAEAGRLEKKEMRAMKKGVKKFEKENRQWIILYRTSARWWAMGGISQLVYRIWYAPRLGRKPKVHRDTDYNDRFEEGIVSIGDIDNFITRMEELGVKCTERSRYRVSMKLPKKLLPSEIKALKNDEQTRRARVNAVLAPRMSDPELENAIMQIVVISNRDTKDSPMNNKRAEMSVLAEEMWEIFNSVTMDRAKDIEGYQRILRIIDKLMVKARVAYEIQKMSEDDVLKVGSMGRIIEVKTKQLLAEAEGMAEQDDS